MALTLTLINIQDRLLHLTPLDGGQENNGITLDQWFNRTPLGRGAVVSTINVHRLTDSIGGN